MSERYKVEHVKRRDDGKIVVLLSDNILTHMHHAPKDETTMTKLVFAGDELMQLYADRKEQEAKE